MARLRARLVARRLRVLRLGAVEPGHEAAPLQIRQRPAREGPRHGGRDHRPLGGLEVVLLLSRVLPQVCGTRRPHEDEPGDSPQQGGQPRVDGLPDRLVARRLHVPRLGRERQGLDRQVLERREGEEPCDGRWHEAPLRSLAREGRPPVFVQGQVLQVRRLGLDAQAVVQRGDGAEPPLDGLAARRRVPATSSSAGCRGTPTRSRASAST